MRTLAGLLLLFLVLSWVIGVDGLAVIGVGVAWLTVIGVGLIILMILTSIFG